MAALSRLPSRRFPRWKGTRWRSSDRSFSAAPAPRVRAATMGTNRANLETALRIALANPVQGLAFIDGLLGDPLAPIAVMSDVERAYLRRTLRQHQETPLGAPAPAPGTKSIATRRRRARRSARGAGKCGRSRLTPRIENSPLPYVWGRLRRVQG